MEFPKSFVDHIPRMKSDHYPILVCLGINVSLSQRKSTNRFQSCWLLDPQFSQLVIANWNNHTDFVSACNNLMGTATAWNKEVFGNIFHQKEKLLT